MDPLITLSTLQNINWNMDDFTKFDTLFERALSDPAFHETPIRLALQCVSKCNDGDFYRHIIESFFVSLSPKSKICSAYRSIELLSSFGILECLKFEDWAEYLIKLFELGFQNKAFLAVILRIIILIDFKCYQIENTIMMCLIKFNSNILTTIFETLLMLTNELDLNESYEMMGDYCQLVDYYYQIFPKKLLVDILCYLSANFTFFMISGDSEHVTSSKEPNDSKNQTIQIFERMYSEINLVSRISDANNLDSEIKTSLLSKLWDHYLKLLYCISIFFDNEILQKILTTSTKVILSLLANINTKVMIDKLPLTNFISNLLSSYCQLSLKLQDDDCAFRYLCFDESGNILKMKSGLYLGTWCSLCILHALSTISSIFFFDTKIFTLPCFIALISSLRFPYIPADLHDSRFDNSSCNPNQINNTIMKESNIFIISNIIGEMHTFIDKFDMVLCEHMSNILTEFSSDILSCYSSEEPINFTTSILAYDLLRCFGDIIFSLLQTRHDQWKQKCRNKRDKQGKYFFIDSSLQSIIVKLIDHLTITSSSFLDLVSKVQLINSPSENNLSGMGSLKSIDDMFIRKVKLTHIMLKLVTNPILHDTIDTNRNSSKSFKSSIQIAFQGSMSLVQLSLDSHELHKILLKSLVQMVIRAPHIFFCNYMDISEDTQTIQNLDKNIYNHKCVIHLNIVRSFIIFGTFHHPLGSTDEVMSEYSKYFHILMMYRRSTVDNELKIDHAKQDKIIDRFDCMNDLLDYFIKNIRNSILKSDIAPVSLQDISNDFLYLSLGQTVLKIVLSIDTKFDCIMTQNISFLILFALDPVCGMHYFFETISAKMETISAVYPPKGAITKNSDCVLTKQSNKYDTAFDLEVLENALVIGNVQPKFWLQFTKLAQGFFSDALYCCYCSNPEGPMNNDQSYKIFTVGPALFTGYIMLNSKDLQTNVICICIEGLNEYWNSTILMDDIAIQTDKILLFQHISMVTVELAENLLCHRDIILDLYSFTASALMSTCHSAIKIIINLILEDKRGSFTLINKSSDETMIIWYRGMLEKYIQLVDIINTINLSHDADMHLQNTKMNLNMVIQTFDDMLNVFTFIRVSSTSTPQATVTKKLRYSSIENLDLFEVLMEKFKYHFSCKAARVKESIVNIGIHSLIILMLDRKPVNQQYQSIMKNWMTLYIAISEDREQLQFSNQQLLFHDCAMIISMTFPSLESMTSLIKDVYFKILQKIIQVAPDFTKILTILSEILISDFELTMHQQNLNLLITSVISGIWHMYQYLKNLNSDYTTDSHSNSTQLLRAYRIRCFEINLFLETLVNHQPSILKINRLESNAVRLFKESVMVLQKFVKLYMRFERKNSDNLPEEFRSWNSELTNEGSGKILINLTEVPGNLIEQDGNQVYLKILPHYREKDENSKCQLIPYIYEILYEILEFFITKQ